MADAEIEILIKAVDQMSGTLNSIEGTLEKTQKNIQKTTDNTSRSFDKQMGSLLVLGQAAGTVEHIQSSYVNLQLRLENASERVANAQDRLRKAQYNLSKVQKNTSATAEDLAEANQDVESATRSLTISQNNLARAHNQVMGTYINIGVQVISLTRQMPLLIAEVRSLTIESLAFAATPLWGTLIAIGLVVTAVTLTVNAQKKAFEEVTAAEENYKASTEALKSVQKSMTDEIGKTESALINLNERYASFAGYQSQTEKELIAQRDQLIVKQKQYQEKIGYSGGRTVFDVEIDKIQNQIDLETAKRTARQSTFDLETTNMSIMAGKYAEQEAYMKMPFEKQLEYFKTTYHTEFLAELDKINAELLAKERSAAQSVADAWNKANQAKAKAVGISRMIETLSFMPVLGGMPVAPIGKNKGMMDFISRPGQEPISFSSDDTIIGTKGGLGGYTIIVEGDVYGYDDFKRKVDRAMYDSLKNKMGQI